MERQMTLNGWLRGCSQPLRLAMVLGVGLLIAGCTDTGISTPTNNNPTAKKVLDHFKFYKVDVNLRDGRTPLKLKGQFDNGFRDHVLINLTHFGNPVSKNHEGIKDKYAHLTWYDLECTLEAQKTATVVNQFGKDKLTVQFSTGLLAPAKKIEPYQQFPKGLNHFKLYSVEKFRKFKPRVVTLKDQFDKKPIKVKLIKPVFLAVPVAKKHAGEYFPKLDNANSKNHLVLYRYEPVKYNVKRSVNDQFQGGDLRNFEARYLAVPSAKPVVLDGLPKGEEAYYSDKSC